MTLPTSLSALSDAHTADSGQVVLPAEGLMFGGTKSTAASATEIGPWVGADSESDALGATLPCEEHSAAEAVSQCVRDQYVQIDSRLNTTYTALMITLSAEQQESLDAAEASWITFRDLDCAVARDQSVLSEAYTRCLAARTQVRHQELSGIPKTLSAQQSDINAQLDESYRALLQALNETGEAQLAQAQLAWINYRNSNCEFESVRYADDIDEIQCMARMSAIRSAQLETLKGDGDGNT